MAVQDLMRGARIAVNQCMAVKPGESVLILTDREIPQDISESLRKASEEVGAKVDLEIMEPLERDGQEPPKEIAKLMISPDVLFIVTSKSLTHTKARREASKQGVRVASMPHVTRFSFEKGALTADYYEIRKLCKKMLKKIKHPKSLKITSENGTNVLMKVGKYRWNVDDGIYHKKGDYGNLPAGEVSTAPNERTTNGIIVFDKMGEYGENIKIIVKDGYAVKISGSKKLENDTEMLGKKSRLIAEIGIGTNPKARVIGNVLEDEKVLGTVHIASGNNMAFGGKNDVPFHVDGVIVKSTLKADKKILIKNGKWLI